MQSYRREKRLDRGIPFDLNPDNDVPLREYPYTREQVNRYLGWLAVRLSERMQTVLPFDRLYSFLAQKPENKINQKFWTEVKLTNAVSILLLKQVNTDYWFVHRLLQDHFARRLLKKT